MLQHNVVRNAPILPLAELSQAAGRYLITPLDEPGQTERITPESSIVMAFGAVARLASDGSYAGLGYLIDPENLRSRSPEVGQAAVELFESIESEAPLSPALGIYSKDNLADVIKGKRGLMTGEQLVAGMVVRETDRGLRADPFINRSVDLELRFRAGSMEDLITHYRRNHRQPPQELRAQVRELGARSRDKTLLPRAIGKVMRAAWMEAAGGKSEFVQAMGLDSHPLVHA